LSAAPAPPGRPLCIAHRGASARAPENTLIAFETAIRLGADAIELDVHLTRDEVPVVLHDETLERTTDGRGPVAVVPLAALQRLDAGSWFAPRFRRERVPTLEQALDCARGRCGMNIELKLPRGRGGGNAARRRDERADAARLARAVGRTLERVRFAELLVLSSFSMPALRAARAVLPRARLGLLVSRRATGLRAAHRALELYSFHPHLRLASARRIRMARRIGLRVMVWPVNDRENIERLAGLEVDGVMTDDPLLFRRLALPPRAARRGGAS
jgi:glycerophosphoryl diester phosphodiesterase